VALTTAGLVGHAQSLSRTLSAELKLYELKQGKPMTVKGAATLTANILVGRPHYVQLLIVGVDSSGPSVYSIDSAGGSIPDVYCATGSGSPYMYGVLEDQFKPNMSEKDALKVAAKALLASAQRDAASGNGMDLAVITPEVGYRQLTEVEVSSLIQSL
ncbi:MAG: proteasome subunit beta, partial [Candidatus Thermoplasmatota archaeon]|nr:proteasome subunit beta [Candidatus Thermoplasmatota archaeon]